MDISSLSDDFYGGSSSIRRDAAAPIQIRPTPTAMQPAPGDGISVSDQGEYSPDPCQDGVTPAIPFPPINIEMTPWLT
jgi:hypothetical protein